MPTPRTATATGSMLVNAMTLGIDLVTAEVLGAFGDAGLDSILLKGPTLRREL
jgi:hypothetical protein